MTFSFFLYLQNPYFILHKKKKILPSQGFQTKLTFFLPIFVNIVNNKQIALGWVGLDNKCEFASSVEDEKLTKLFKTTFPHQTRKKRNDNR